MTLRFIFTKITLTKYYDCITGMAPEPRTRFTQTDRFTVIAYFSRTNYLVDKRFGLLTNKQQSATLVLQQRIYIPIYLYLLILSFMVFQIKVELYKADGSLLHYVEFNASSSNTSYDWFDAGNFLSSSWDDLTGVSGSYDIWDLFGK